MPYFFVDVHLQIIESISPKASVQNSSAQWAISLNILVTSYSSADLPLVSIVRGGTHVKEVMCDGMYYV